MQIGCQAKQKFTNPHKIHKVQRSRVQGLQILTPRVSAHPCFLQSGFILQVRLCYLKKKLKKNQKQWHHRKINFLSPFDFHSSALQVGSLTAETSRCAYEGSALLLIPPSQLPLPLLFGCLPHPWHPSSSASSSGSLLSPRELRSLAPKVLQITFLNVKAKPGRNCRKKTQMATEGGKLKSPITNHHSYFINSL